MIVTLSPDKHMELVVKALLAISCRFCNAPTKVMCNTENTGREDLFHNGGDDYWPVHQKRMDDAMPMYEAACVIAKEEIRQAAIANARARYAGSTKTHSDFYKPAGEEVHLHCNYCNAEPGQECRTMYGNLTKSHRSRLLRYRMTNTATPREELFSCTTCNARPGRKCVTASGAQATVYHAPRRKLSNV